MSRRSLLRTSAALSGAGFVVTSSGLAVPVEALEGTTSRTTLNTTPAVPAGRTTRATARSPPGTARGTWSAPTSGCRPTAAGRADGKSLLAFVQLSDVHIKDSQSPLRTEYLDR